MRNHRVWVGLVLVAALMMVPASASASVGLGNFIHEVLARIHQVVETSTRPVRAEATQKNTSAPRAQSSRQPRVDSHAREEVQR